MKHSRMFFSACNECVNELTHYCEGDRACDMIINNSVINVQSVKPTLSTIEFTVERIEGFIDNIKSSSSTSLDGISAKIMKSGKTTMVKMLAIIGENSMNSNIFWRN